MFIFLISSLDGDAATAGRPIDAAAPARYGPCGQSRRLSFILCSICLGAPQTLRDRARARQAADHTTNFVFSRAATGTFLSVT